jgi:hypothetical protein
MCNKTLNAVKIKQKTGKKKKYKELKKEKLHAPKTKPDT